MKTSFAIVIALTAISSISAASRPQPTAVVLPPSSAPEALDRERIHADYNDGDFEAVASALESFMQRNKTCSHDDSVFIAKHLSVVYSANPAMREKGKYYMYRLLDLVPSAKLVDMFVSDEIDRIFEKVREEYYVRKGGPVPEVKPAEPNNVAVAEEEKFPPVTPTSPAEKPKSSSTLKILAWTGAGVVVVGAGVTTYLLLQSAPSSHIYGVDARTQVP